MANFTLKTAWHGAVEIIHHAHKATVHTGIMRINKTVRFLTNGGRHILITHLANQKKDVLSPTSILTSEGRKETGMDHYMVEDNLPSPRWIGRIDKEIFRADNRHELPSSVTFRPNPDVPGKFSILLDKEVHFSDYASSHPLYFAVDSVVIKVTADAEGDLTFRIWDRGVGTNTHLFHRPDENDNAALSYRLTIQGNLEKPIRFVGRLADLSPLAVNPFGGF
jgi:hypothetical protein